MESRRWTSRLVLALPAALMIGILAVALTSEGTARAKDAISIPCPTLTSLLPSPVNSAVCKTVRKVKRKVTHTVNKTVHHLLGGSGGSGGSSGGSGGGKKPTGRHSHSRTRHGSRSGQGAVSLPAFGAGALSPFGMPDWLFRSGMGSAGQAFPLLNPAHPPRRADRQHRGVLAAKRTGVGQAPVWLLAVLGTIGLIGGAGGHFLGWPGLRRRKRQAGYGAPSG